MNVKKDEIFKSYVATGENIFSSLKIQLKKDFDSFIAPDSALSGTKMQNEWFPLIKSDVFISHSHQDKDYALFLAGWLKTNFAINCFIDSCVWGYAKDLQKELDLKYSQPLLPNQSKYYDSVAYTASHVNMMLTNALCFMMDKTECFIFLNTPNALKSFDKVDKTESPWIYTEISLSKTLKITPPLRPIEESVLFNADTSKPKLTIRYNLDLSHLTKLNISQLFTALPGKNYNTSQKALDAIYKII